MIDSEIAQNQDGFDEFWIYHKWYSFSDNGNNKNCLALSKYDIHFTGGMNSEIQGLPPSTVSLVCLFLFLSVCHSLRRVRQDRFLSFSTSRLSCLSVF